MRCVLVFLLQGGQIVLETERWSRGEMRTRGRRDPTRKSGMSR